MRRACGLAAAVATLTVTGAAAAQTVTLGALLTGGQEVPTAINTPASGFGRLTWDQGMGVISIHLSVRNLIGTTVPVGPGGGPGHVHLGAPGANGPIVIPVTNAPIGATSFDVMQSYTFADLAGFGVAQANLDVLATRLNSLIGADVGTDANLYFNVHTTFSGAGEIRGDLAVVPEPSTYALMATGLGLVGAIGWRRRRVA